eukprot:1637553-Pleurochrysis_carterae.AAC.3
MDLTREASLPASGCCSTPIAVCTRSRPFCCSRTNALSKGSTRRNAAADSSSSPNALCSSASWRDTKASTSTT